jgi:hypothetical protein
MCPGRPIKPADNGSDSNNRRYEYDDTRGNTDRHAGSDANGHSDAEHNTDDTSRARGDADHDANPGRCHANGLGDAGHDADSHSGSDANCDGYPGNRGKGCGNSHTYSINGGKGTNRAAINANSRIEIGWVTIE